jgi:hypothetical protein
MFRYPEQVAQAVQHSPLEAAAQLDNLGVSYTEKLSALGLPSTATPSELFDKVAKTSSQVYDGNAGLQTHIFDDGSMISSEIKNISDGDSVGKLSISSFKTADGSFISLKTGTGPYFDSLNAQYPELRFDTPLVAGIVGENGQITAVYPSSGGGEVVITGDTKNGREKAQRRFESGS